MYCALNAILLRNFFIVGSKRYIVHVTLILNGEEWSSYLQKHLPKHDTDKTTWLTFEFRNKTTHNNSKRKTLGESSGKHLLIFRQKNPNRRHY